MFGHSTTLARSGRSGASVNKQEPQTDAILGWSRASALFSLNSGLRSVSRPLLSPFHARCFPFATRPPSSLNCPRRTTTACSYELPSSLRVRDLPFPHVLPVPLAWPTHTHKLRLETARSSCLSVPASCLSDGLAASVAAASQVGSCLYESYSCKWSICPFHPCQRPSPPDIDRAFWASLPCWSCGVGQKLRCSRAPRGWDCSGQPPPRRPAYQGEPYTRAS